MTLHTLSFSPSRTKVESFRLFLLLLPILVFLFPVVCTQFVAIDVVVGWYCTSVYSYIFTNIHSYGIYKLRYDVSK